MYGNSKSNTLSILGVQLNICISNKKKIYSQQEAGGDPRLTILAVVESSLLTIPNKQGKFGTQKKMEANRSIYNVDMRIVREMNECLKFSTKLQTL